MPYIKEKVWSLVNLSLPKWFLNDNLNSGRCFMLFRKHKITPPPDFSCVTDQSFLMWSKPLTINWLLEILLFKNVSHIPSTSGPFSQATDMLYQ